MNACRRVLPYGSWPSPIGAEQIAGATIRLGQTAARDGATYWLEGRPAEHGRNVLVRQERDGRIVDINPPPFDVRTRVHEYGGGAYALLDDGGLAFIDNAGQQIHLSNDDATTPRQLTRAPQQRFADLLHDARRNRLVAVREDHRPGDIDAVTTLVGIDLATGDVQVIAEGHDFFASPCLSPDGRSLAWLTWDHPDMPWDASVLWQATIEADGMLSNVRRVAGASDESIFQPSWSPQGGLHFVSDRTGWWNLYRMHAGSVEALCPMQAEFGVPQWAFGMSSHGFDGAGRIVCSVVRDACASLVVIDPEAGTCSDVETPFCSIHQVRVDFDSVVFLAARPTAPEAVVRLDLSGGSWQVLRSASTALPDPAFVSVAEPITFSTGDGTAAHAFFHAPVNGDARGPEGSKPPLIVVTHGGPTGSSDMGLRLPFQFFTSRGFALVDVNYRGSSGYGRAYREALKGGWGVVDVDDCVAAARFLVQRGDVDADRLAIRGASAGGFTTLAALTFRDAFKAGASHYGVSDLESLARDTHKFESRYLDSLVGPYPERADLYRQRSPIHFADRLSSALILFQGAEDKAVPPSQAEAMYEAVRAKGLPVAYLLFEGEQHGFRQARNIRRALEAELAFYGRVFGFVPADAISEPLVIDNLD